MKIRYARGILVMTASGVCGGGLEGPQVVTVTGEGGQGGGDLFNDEGLGPTEPYRSLRARITLVNRRTGETRIVKQKWNWGTASYGECVPPQDLIIPSYRSFVCGNERPFVVTGRQGLGQLGIGVDKIGKVESCRQETNSLNGVRHTYSCRFDYSVTWMFVS